MQIYDFTYDGIMCQVLKSTAPYSITFKEWTNDPGIMLCECSDGVNRKIPTCTLKDTSKLSKIPNQDKSKSIVIGYKSSSFDSTDDFYCTVCESRKSSYKMKKLEEDYIGICTKCYNDMLEEESE
jgi:hypothetical protein